MYPAQAAVKTYHLGFSAHLTQSVNTFIRLFLLGFPRVPQWNFCCLMLNTKYGPGEHLLKNAPAFYSALMDPSLTRQKPGHLQGAIPSPPASPVPILLLTASDPMGSMLSANLSAIV